MYTKQKLASKSSFGNEIICDLRKAKMQRQCQQRTNVVDLV